MKSNAIMTEQPHIQRVNTEIDVVGDEPIHHSRAFNVQSLPGGNKAFGSNLGSQEASKFEKIPLKLNPSSRLASPCVVNEAEGSV